MKKRIFSLMIGAVVALASCSKSEEAPIVPQSGEQTATFTIAAPATRGVADLSRYIVEAYEDNDFTATPQRVEAATGELTLTLKKNTVYTFVFWADNGTANTAVATSNDYYDATSLQDVKVTPSAYATVATPAYALAVSFNSKDFETKKSVTLKNATAQINFVEGAGLLTADNSLMVKYSSGGKLNVATGVITEIGAEISRTYPNIEATAQDGILATDYILAPLGEKRLLDLKVTFNTEAEKTIPAVPFQQSYKTNIKGEFSNMYASVFTVSNEVEDYTNNPDVEFPEKIAIVGDFYYSDDTFSNTLDTDKTCIGIVFWVDPANAKKGKIVSLDEGNARWGKLNYNETEGGIEGLKDDDSGVAATWNMIAKYKDAENFATEYAVFKWILIKNSNVMNGPWYLPAIGELGQLSGQGEVCPIINASLANIVGAPQIDGFYWSSKENNHYGAWYHKFLHAGPGYDGKSSENKIRAISAFDLTL